jgi:hypothetical protein
MAEGACHICSAGTDLLCPKCERYYCAKCASLFNKKLCLDCGPNTSLGLEVTDGIPDVDGEVHHGRTFKLIGEGWPDQIEKISELSDAELEAKLDFFKRVLKEVVRVRDTMLITLSAMENERFRRTAEKLKPTGGTDWINRSHPETEGIKIQSKSKTSSEEDSVKNLAKALGITVEKARAVYQKLKGVSAK